jgi:hypothetical protein
VLLREDFSAFRFSSSDLRDVVEPVVFFFVDEERPMLLPVSLRPVKAAFHILLMVPIRSN